MIFKKDAQPKEPQLIMWDAGYRIFRPAQILFKENYMGFDITEHLIPKGEVELKPSSLSNIGTVYLGNIHAVNELAQQSQMVLPKDYLEKVAKWQRAILGHIFERSFDIAGEYNATHFSLFNRVEPCTEEKSRAFRFSSGTYADMDYLMRASIGKYDFSKKEVTNPVEWNIHPTVNLYIPRK